MFKNLAGLLVALLVTLAAFAQEVDTTMWITNGNVKTIVRNGNTVYLGGNFTGVGPYTGSGATMNVGNGKLATLPAAKIMGTVHASVPDGKGGWFVGGGFKQVGNLQRTGIAHILADGRVDPEWDAAIGGGTELVLTLALAGNTLYVGGYFTTMGGQSRNYLGAVNARTGQVTDWNPRVNWQVNAIGVLRNTVYIAGNFSLIGGQVRNRLGAIDATTGLVTAWNPVSDYEVNELLIAGSTVYVAGGFTRIGGQSRKYLAALDVFTGQATRWDPSPNAPVQVIILGGNTIYVGGNFSSIDRQFITNVAAFDATTGKLNAWRPATQGAVTTMAFSGGAVVLNGREINSRILGSCYLNAVDTLTGQTSYWKTTFDRYISTLSVSGNTLFAGGDFTSVGLQERSGLAAFNAVTGEATPWSPALDLSWILWIDALAVAGEKVYVGGQLTLKNERFSRSLAAFDGNTGEAASPGIPNPNGNVKAMAVSGNTLYLGGSFVTVGGQTRSHLAAIDLTTHQLTPWNPAVNTAAVVNALAVRQGVVFAGGEFSSVNGQQRRHLAAIDAATGQVTAWNPDIPLDGRVNALAFFVNTLYVGGNFQAIGASETRSGAAAFDAVTAQATDWNPAIGPFANVNALAVSDKVIYLGGSFNPVAGQEIKCLTGVDPITGRQVLWDPKVTGFAGSLVVQNLLLYQGTLHAGGVFEGVQGQLSPNFAVFRERLSRSSFVQGTVYEDVNGDCVKNTGEKGIAARVVMAQPGDYFSFTDSLGNYSIRVDTGSYTVEQVLPSDLAAFTKVVCPANPARHAVRVTRYDSTVLEKDFANQTTPRPHLSVAISSDRRRRCFTGLTVVSYCNEGTAAAQNVQVHVQLPNYVALVSAGRPYAKDREGNYVFTIGTLAAGSCGTIQLVDSVVCNNPDIRGLTQCTRAWITPANDRIPDPEWDRSDITLKARCGDNGRVRLALYNTGAAGMADSSAYRIYLDAQLAFTRNYKLAKGDSLVLNVTANGRTVRLEAGQRPAHPDKRQSNITVEACGTNSEGKVSKGYVCQMPPDDEEPEVAVECLPIIDSFDPNDKAVSPQGVTDQHYTPTGRALAYVVRFQNTGTDVAYKVVVVDTLSEHLDISTLRVGAVSHPYKLHVSGKGRPVLTFTFDNINLPDSNANEPASHGRIQFSIMPKAGLPEKTRVENFADIFFDYNEPVRTNTTVNALYDLPPVVADAVALAPSDVCPAVNTVAVAGADRVVCTQDTVGLRAVQPSEGNGKWRLVKGAGIFSEAKRPDATVTGLAYGENVFEWRIPASRCNTDSVAATVTVTRLQKPVPLITQLGADQLVCSVAGIRYEWFRDGVKLGGPGQQIQVNAPGRYTVRVETAEGCQSDLSEAFAYGVTGLVTSATPAVRVFPNPTPGRLVIDVPIAQAGPVHVRVVDNLGRTVLTQTFRHAGHAGAFRAELDLSAQATGLYVLKLQTGGGLIVRSVFKK